MVEDGEEGTGLDANCDGGTRRCARGGGGDDGAGEMEEAIGVSHVGGVVMQRVIYDIQ